MLYNIDALEYLQTCKSYRTIFADPPDNLGLNYHSFKDKMSRRDYVAWLNQLIDAAVVKCDVFWLSFNAKYWADVGSLVAGSTARLFIWRFTFGQHNHRDCGNGFRPILRWASPEWKPNTDAIRVRSRRQELGDKRADPRGRVPDDVWEFSRIQGNNRERRKWHPTQHPEALMERIILMSGGPVLDLFSGTGTTLRVARRLGVECDGVEIDPFYCEKMVA